MELHLIKEQIQELEYENQNLKEQIDVYKGCTPMPPCAISWQEKIDKNNIQIQILTEKMFDSIQPPKPVGRPSLGVTKKVSITLPQEVWEFIEQFESRSAYFRSISIEDYDISIDRSAY